MKKIDLVIIGGGPAGMAAAVSAYNNGIKHNIIGKKDNLILKFFIKKNLDKTIRICLNVISLQSFLSPFS